MCVCVCVVCVSVCDILPRGYKGHLPISFPYSFELSRTSCFPGTPFRVRSLIVTEAPSSCVLQSLVLSFETDLGTSALSFP